MDISPQTAWQLLSVWLPLRVGQWLWGRVLGWAIDRTVGDSEDHVHEHSCGGELLTCIWLVLRTVPQKRLPLNSGIWVGSDKHIPPPLLPQALPSLTQWAVCNQLAEQIGKVPGNLPVYLKAIVFPTALGWTCVLEREFSSITTLYVFLNIALFHFLFVLWNTLFTLACSFSVWVGVFLSSPFLHFINFT